MGVNIYGIHYISLHIIVDSCGIFLAIGDDLHRRGVDREVQGRRGGGLRAGLRSGAVAENGGKNGEVSGVGSVVYRGFHGDFHGDFMDLYNRN